MVQAVVQGFLEMLMQSHGGRIRNFPAVPDEWKDLSFANVRAEGALLLTATRTGGRVNALKILSEKGGAVRLVDPFDGRAPQVRSCGVGPITISNGLLDVDMKAGGHVEFMAQEALRS